MTTRTDRIEAAARALRATMRSGADIGVTDWHGVIARGNDLDRALDLPPDPPDPPLARETAMRVAEGVNEAIDRVAMCRVSRRDLAAIVDRVLGPASEVELAEREVVEAAVRAQEAIRASEAEPTRTMLMDAYLRAGYERVRAIDRLHAARERAGR